MAWRSGGSSRRSCLPERARKESAMRPATSRFALAAPIMVAVAAMLWGTDGIFRTALIAAMPANAIVLWEHILLTAATGWILWRDRASLSRLNGGDWVAAVVV